MKTSRRIQVAQNASEKCRTNNNFAKLCVSIKKDESDDEESPPAFDLTELVKLYPTREALRDALSERALAELFPSPPTQEGP